MKTKITLLIAAFFVCLTITAQTKVGTINREYIVSKMPQLKIAQERIAKYGAKLDSINDSKITKHDAAVKAFNENLKTLSEEDKKTKFTEITTLKQEITQFQKNGTTMIQLRRNDFMRPLYQKVNEVVEEVAKEKGYTQILTLTGNDFAYIDEKFDITKLVLTKLGIKE